MSRRLYPLVLQAARFGFDRSVVPLLRRANLELRRPEQPSDLPSVLERMRDLGILPATVLDVGAAYGDWSRASAAIWPTARHVLIEPLQEYAKSLASTVAELSSAHYIEAAASSRDGMASINVHRDLVGSSLLSETEEGVDGQPRATKSVRLDTVVNEYSLSDPFLLKVDVQGHEIEVLAGAQAVLDRTEVVVLEVSLLSFFVGGPLVGQVVAYMFERGFVLYDLVNLLYRPLDGALAQFDAVFVQSDSQLRSHHSYATKEQRSAQDAEFRQQDGQRRRAAER